MGHMVVGERCHRERRDGTSEAPRSAVGAVTGVPAGTVLGLLLHNAIAYGLMTIATLLTVVSFRRYLFDFGARCFCISCVLVIAGRSAAVAAERVINFLLGGAIGVLACSGYCHVIKGRANEVIERKESYVMRKDDLVS